MEKSLNCNPTAWEFKNVLLKKNLWASLVLVIYCSIIQVLQPLHFERIQVKTDTFNYFILVWLPTSTFVFFWTKYVRQRRHEMLVGLQNLKKFLSIIHFNCKEDNEKMTREISLLVCLAMTEFCASFSPAVYKKYSKLTDLVNENYLTFDDAVWLKKNDLESLSLKNLSENIDEKLKNDERKKKS